MKKKIRKMAIDLYWSVKAHFDKKNSETIEEYIARVRPLEEEYKKWLVSNPLPFPSKQQIEWLEAEIGLFCHFGINTYYDKEWTDGTKDKRVFNPSKLDCRQWLKVAQDLGAKYMIVTAKHHDGFCLWPTKTTDYSIAHTPYKDGNGDIVKEFLDVCKESGMKCGVYLSPWDRHEVNCGCYDDEKAYDEMYAQQLTELLSNYDTEIFEAWFDGAGSKGHTYNWEKIIGVVEKHQPRALIFNMGKPTIRWVGNESGLAKESNWFVVQEGAELATVDDDARNLGMVIEECDGLGNIVMPAECDTPLHYYHWFWHPKDDNSLKSMKELMRIYYYSVGRGSDLLLNIAPNRDGLIDEIDANRAKEYGEKIRDLYTNPIAQTNGKGNNIEISLEKPQQLRAVMIQEDISKGQRVREYFIEYQSSFKSGGWQLIYHGTSIGHKRIEQINSKENITKIRLKVEYSFGEPIISNFAVF